ncbi:MAG: phosphate signaling complex protein PhoU [Verrucomicrobia bacterium]|nr:phosphate signaling complex protein PhoU [Verrucomicrobiota bacterium]
MNKYTPTHLEESLQRDLEGIRLKLIEMADRDVEALRNALRALLENNRMLAFSVILRDKFIDELETELDHLCLRFFVRQQPVAGHLRFVFATIKIIKELERIGDYAESVARQVLKVAKLEPKPSYDKFIQIADLSVPMLQDAIKAFIDNDPQLARKTMKTELAADRVRTEINNYLYSLRQNEELPLDALTPLITVARRFERVADQAKNICEEVFYVATGEYVKHRQPEKMRILFVDKTNSCLSQMAEGLGKSLGKPRLIFESAGIQPQSMDLQTVGFLAEKGIDIARQGPKSIEQIEDLTGIHVLIALCDEAKKIAPQSPTKTVVMEWSISDPVPDKGTPEEMRNAYETAYENLKNHIQDLADAILEDKPKGDRSYED